MADNQVFTIVSTMKNEGPYILEWVAHYKALGFDRFVVCTNDCEDTTVEILKRLEEMGLVRHHPTVVRKAGIHRSALRQASRYEEVTTADWVFVCDVDEFLNIHVGDHSVRALVAASGPEADVICVPWRVFGSNGITLFRDRPVTAQFTRAERPVTENPGAGKFVKSLFRGLERFQRMGLHMPVLPKENPPPVNYVLPGGAPYIENGARSGHPPVFNVAQVNHYALRSMDSFFVKRDRGRANHMNHVLGLEYWDRFDHNDVEDSSIRRYDAARAEWLDRFRADSELWRLHRQAVGWHKAKARALRRAPDYAPLLAGIRERLGMTGPRRAAAADGAAAGGAAGADGALRTAAE